MKKSITTFQIQTGTKKRLITTYRSNREGAELRLQHQSDLALLEQNYPINQQFTFAYVKQKSIRQLVNKHLDSQYFYQYDVADFFGSIDHQILLSKLVKTSPDYNRNLIYQSSNGKSRGLALGLVPSPYLSNIYLDDFDCKLSQELNSLAQHIVYTRYSDDLTISSDTALDQELITSILSKHLADLGLRLNSRKTRFVALEKKAQHIKILGLNIIRGDNSNYITVGRKFKTATYIESNPIRKHAMSAYIDYNEH